MQNGLEGRIDLGKPAGWDQIYDRLLQKEGEVKDRAIHIAQYCGDQEAIRHYFTTMQNTDAIPTDRSSALEALAAQQREELVPELPKLLHDRALRSSVIRAIASYDEYGLGRLLLNNYSEIGRDHV